MNQFTWKQTVVSRSSFRFAKKSTMSQFQGTGQTTISLATPKVPRTTPFVHCVTEFTLGDKNSSVEIFISADSTFAIDETQLDEKTLQEDAKRDCVPIALRNLTDKLNSLILLHTGKTSNISIPIIEED